jgi:hypothetical protein
MGNVIKRIEKEILSWPYVTAEPHRFGGLEFRFNKRELGHLHGDLVVVFLNFTGTHKGEYQGRPSTNKQTNKQTNK